MTPTGLSTGKTIKALEVEGYSVLTALLDRELAVRLRTELEALPLRCSSYTDKQWFAHNLQWARCPSVWDLIRNPAALAFLLRLFGDEAVCVSVSYSRSDPGYPGMPLHTDSHPYGSNILAGAGTPPVLVRLLYYLDPLTCDRAPLRVVPYSHLSLHYDAMPYTRFPAHPDERVITCDAGDAVVINQRVFHGAGANRADTSRSLVAVSYRPAWARPTIPVPEPLAEDLGPLPEDVRRLVDRPNRGVGDTNIVNWREGMPDGGDGAGPRRWNRRFDRARSAARRPGTGGGAL
jgi:ectoine hydroxylase-related dioxygenase (phytanoyl-CoA dioxygenase family)